MLDRAAEVITMAFAFEHGEIDLAAGDRGEFRQVVIDEAFVMAQVQVRFGAVVRDEDFAMLVGRHGAGVNVEIGVELLDGDGDAAGLENPAETGGGDALAHRTDDAAGHKDVFRHFPPQNCLFKKDYVRPSRLSTNVCVTGSPGHDPPRC